MLSLKQLAARAFTLLRTQPVLWTPPLGVALLSTLLLPTSAGPMAIMVLVSGLFSLAVTAGWYALIARADVDERPLWDDFFEAIGRHFAPLVLGTVLFFLVVGLLAVPAVVGAALWAGPGLLNRLQSELPGLLTQAQTHPEVLTTIDPALVTAFNRLMLGLIGAATWYALVNVVLLFWKQATVLGHQGWIEAWRTSMTMLRTHFALVMGLLTLEGLLYVATASLSVLPFPLGAFGWLGMVGVHVWSTTAFTVLYARVYPPLRTADSASVSPTGLPS